MRSAAWSACGRTTRPRCWRPSRPSGTARGMGEAVKACKEGARLGKISLIGFDENEETLQGIQDGHVFCTVVQDPYKFGYEAVKIMAGLAKGDDSVLEKYKPDKNKRI